MAKQSVEHIRVWNPDNGVEHYLTVTFDSGPEEAVISASYESGCTDIEQGASVACWNVTFEPPAVSDEGEVFDDGNVWFGDGRIDIDIGELRGIGLGSLLMLPLVQWAKDRPADVPVVPIDLAGPDAKTSGERDRRNRFYEKLGFTFDYKENKTHGTSREMMASALLTPAFKMSRRWLVESLSPTSSVFRAG